MSRRGEPVRHTCPDIDKIKLTIATILDDISNYSSKDKKSDILDAMESWASELKDIGVGSRCELEELRSANAALREWGNEMYDDAENLETAKDFWENRCAELESKIEDLESTIEDLREE